MESNSISLVHTERLLFNERVKILIFPFVPFFPPTPFQTNLTINMQFTIE